MRSPWENMELRLFGEPWPRPGGLASGTAYHRTDLGAARRFGWPRYEDVIRHLQPVGICPRGQLEEASWIASMLSKDGHPRRNWSRSSQRHVDAWRVHRLLARYTIFAHTLVQARLKLADLWDAGLRKFDNETRFQGAHEFRDTIGRDIRLGRGVGVTPLFAPPREPFSRSVESFIARW